jgi:SAM-dependent methyltransferase
VNAPIQCRVCARDDTVFLSRVYNEHSGTSELDVFICRFCGSVFIGNAITTEELAVAYGDLDEESYYAEIAETTQKKFELSARELAQLIPATAHVLDLGAGNGGFLRTLHEIGFRNLYAHELPSHDLSVLRDVALECYADSDYRTVPDNAFDAVTMLDVLEHVPDPAATIGACSRVLKPHGVLYLHTPCVSRLDRLMHGVQRWPKVGKLGRIWQRGRTSIFHLQNYTPLALRELLERTGMELVRLEVRNELSWPLARYVRVFLLEKQGLPAWPASLIAPLLWPLKTRINANKATVVATKR